MDDEFSDLFLLNDCLISGRLSPGPADAPDVFLGQGGAYDGMLLGSNGHNGEVMSANFMCFDGGEADLGYPRADSPRRLSLIGPIARPMDRMVSNVTGASFALVKTEDPSCPLSPSGRSPDHDYINDIKIESLPVDSGASSYGGGNICSSRRASSMEYCHGTSGDGNSDSGVSVKYDIDDYYVDSVETKPFRDVRITSSAHNGNANSIVGNGGVLFSSVTSGVIGSVLDPPTINVGAASYSDNAAMDRDVWPCGPIPLREDDVAPLGDDNSSTTSGDSCSNCGYLSSGSPAPGPKHGTQASFSPHQKGNSLRYRSTNSSASSTLNLNVRTRSKMHELALKHNLISEQVGDSRSKGYVLLSTEERRTLIQEGLPVPTKLPLSKQEEEALKIVRRKIKNKLSAQESRRKRKEYMETLEQQIEGYQSENTSLRRRIDALEKTNHSLLDQLKKLQQQLSPAKSPSTATSLVVGSASSFDSQSTTRGNSNVHHTVSLAAVFLLFAVMIPAMPIWPSVFRNAFIVGPLSKAPHIDDTLPDAYFDHSSSTAAFPASRVLWSGSGNGDCEIPYSADYFEKLNECRPADPDVRENEPAKEVLPSRVVYSAVVNYTDRPSLLTKDEDHVSAMAVCETLACREAMTAGKTVAKA